MKEFTIWYADGLRVEGSDAEDWRAAPDAGVQVVVEWREPEPHERRWTGVDDRCLWTGRDEYDPFGWGVKYGSLIDDDEYEATWREAFYGDR